MLLLIPNISEGRDANVITAVASAYTGAGAVLLDTHSDPDHHRTVHTLAAPDPAAIPAILRAGVRAAAQHIDLTVQDGIHPCIGSLDVAPVVYLADDERGLACAAALTAAEELGAEVPVFLYGALAGGRTRAEIRRGGLEGLRHRLETRELQPDFGSLRLHPTAGAVLVAARPPLVAFNVELAEGATLGQAQFIAAAIREGGADGLRGVRAIGLELTRPDGLGVVQVSTNVEDHRAVPLAAVVVSVSRHAAVAGAELVGLAPQVAFDGFPDDLPIRGRRTVEDALNALSS